MPSGPGEEFLGFFKSFWGHSGAEDYMKFKLRRASQMFFCSQGPNSFFPKNRPQGSVRGAGGVHPDPENRQDSDSGLKKAPEALKSKKNEFSKFRQ